MKNYKKNIKHGFLLWAAILIPLSFISVQAAAPNPPAQQEQYGVEKTIREKFEKEIADMVAANQKKSFASENLQLQDYIQEMTTFFKERVPTLFKSYSGSTAFKKINEEFRKEYGFPPVKDYVIFFNRDRIREILSALHIAFPQPGKINFDDPLVAAKLKKIIIDDIEKAKKEIGTPLGVVELESMFATTQKCVAFTFVSYIMGDHNNDKFECTVHSFFLKVFNEVRAQNKLPAIKDDSCTIL